MLKKGIILIATGHANYGKMAYNLLSTLKVADASIPVALIHDAAAIAHLREDERVRFDFLIELPASYSNGFGAKLHIDQLTPFAKTLYLDVDMLWISQRSPADLFAELNGVNFTIITEGDSDAPNMKYYFWADESEILKKYKLEWVPQTRSEVIYFEKGTKVFSKARELKPERKLLTIRKFGILIPDELYFNIAMGILNVRPHVMNWQPAYWSRLNGDRLPELRDIRKSFYLLSFGSNFIASALQRVYDNYMIATAHKLGIRWYKIQSKKMWAPSRLKM